MPALGLHSRGRNGSVRLSEGMIDNSGTGRLALDRAGDVAADLLVETASSPFRVDVVRTPAGLQALEPDWSRLLTASGITLPFATYEWAEVWWRYFGNDRATIRDSLYVQVVRRHTGEAMAIVPFFVTERPGRGPVRVRTLQLIGADPNITELRTVLVDPAVEAEATDALLAQLARDAHAWDWVHWSGLQRGSRVAETLLRRPGVQWAGDIPDYVLHLAPSWEEFRRGLRRNIRESLRHCANSLARDGWKSEFGVAETPEAVTEGLPTFFALHRLRAQVTARTQHPDHFETRKLRTFLVEVCERLAAKGMAKVFTLRIGGQVVAARLGFVVGDSLYLYYSGFDPAWGKYGVMTTVLAEAIKLAIARGLKKVNLSTGVDVSKTRWGPEEVIYGDVIQLSPRLRSRLAYRTYRLAKARANGKLWSLLHRVLPRRHWG